MSGRAPRRGGPPPDRSAIVWRRKWWILGLSIIVTASAVLVATFLPATYESSARLRIGPQAGAPGSARDAVLASNDLATQYAELADATSVVRAAALRRRESPGAIAKSVSVGTVSGQNLLDVTAQARRPEDARGRADDFADALTAYLRKLNLNQGLDYRRSVREQLAPLDAQILQTRDAVADAQQALPSSGALGQSAASAALAAEQSALTGLLAERQRVLGDTAQIAAGSQVQIQVVERAESAVKVQPKPFLYGIVAFVVALLIIAEIFVLAERGRRSTL